MNLNYSTAKTIQFLYRRRLKNSLKRIDLYHISDSDTGMKSDHASFSLGCKNLESQAPLVGISLMELSTPARLGIGKLVIDLSKSYCDPVSFSNIIIFQSQSCFYHLLQHDSLLYL
jgi:hypothetical protein